MTMTSRAGASRPWPVVESVDGPDWTNGGAFFIRNKRQPDLYWSVSYAAQDVAIVVSETRRSKFRIWGSDIDHKDLDKVLIRSDRVTISPVSSEKSARVLYVHPSKAETNVVVLSGDKKEWRFGDLFGAFGTTWDDNETELVTYNEAEGEEWELC
ncbi:hypothetical protein SISSUDRAFT_1051676 [Sistotremastrum suecicum HHB10207 ss-3]|uniref:Uncharacterized protein n=1 Tax=Sistotremastrum suecicum HHB10207 ss-3 TaxID=1314776 RepID=A0A166AFG1_9AGAM|nr:hypothetical protein SISSUDRAFT_1051676 [Sistotremastrum suecicum HHB10207 ss-3]